MISYLPLKEHIKIFSHLYFLTTRRNTNLPVPNFQMNIKIHFGSICDLIFFQKCNEVNILWNRGSLFKISPHLACFVFCLCSLATTVQLTRIFFYCSFWVCLTTRYSHSLLTWGFLSQGCRSHNKPIKQLVGGLGIAFKDLYKKRM